MPGRSHGYRLWSLHLSEPQSVVLADPGNICMADARHVPFTLSGIPTRVFGDKRISLPASALDDVICCSRVVMRGPRTLSFFLGAHSPLLCSAPVGVSRTFSGLALFVMVLPPETWRRFFVSGIRIYLACNLLFNVSVALRVTGDGRICLIILRIV
ncbi:hypothetical protein BDV97DRAFT_65498 [Delphinella strobiligena]|nr:hypothetical protein BDV97DRAFT_65498 [Delphinella strobiligena]